MLTLAIHLKPIPWHLAEFYYNRGLHRPYTGTCTILQETINVFCPLIQSVENRRKSVTDSGYAYSNFERSNISLKENIPDGVDPNSDGYDCCVRKNEGKIRWFSADCIVLLKVKHIN